MPKPAFTRVLFAAAGTSALLALTTSADRTGPARPDIPIPAHNDPRLEEAPPRPPMGDANERARRLFDAIVHDTPETAQDFFFPRKPFLVLKGIRDPGRYYDKLLAHYVEDIHTLHRTTPDLERASFGRLVLLRRGEFVTRGKEANRLPYWASRHSFIEYQVGSETRRLEVRVLITWDDRWYVTHLRERPRPKRRKVE